MPKAKAIGKQKPTKVSKVLKDKPQDYAKRKKTPRATTPKVLVTEKQTTVTVIKTPKLVRGKTLDNGLTMKEERFCELFSSDREFFGNGVESYAEAFNMDITEYRKYKVAQNGASSLLSKPIILARINEILELRGLNHSFVDKQLELLITQNADFSAKLGGIKEYNKLKARITDKHDVEVIHRFEDMSDEQLDRAIAEKQAREDRTA